METVNVMAKISHGCGGVGSVRSQRRRLVSEPTDSLVLTCDDNNSMKFESLSPNKILIRNDVQGSEGPQQMQVHNNLIASPTSESMLASNDKNEVDRALQMVSESANIFGGKPLQIDETHPRRRSFSHHIIPRPQPHHLVKTLERKELASHSTTGYLTRGLLQVVNGDQLVQKSQVHALSESERTFTRPERLRQHHGYKGNSNGNSYNFGGNGNSPIDNGCKNTPTNSLKVSQLDEEQLTLSQNKSEAATSFECGQCNKIFCSKVQLGRHVKIHSGGDKAFLCSQCEQTFQRKDQLKTHEKTHQVSGMGNEEKAFYECERLGCGKTYNSYSSYMKHRKTHEIAESSLAGEGMKQGTIITPAPHQRTLSVGSGMQLKASAEYNSMVAATSSSTASSTPATNTPSRRSHREQGEKRFQCTQCSKKFPTSKDLKRHDVVHTGNREFQCSFCSHRFGRKDHRMRHEKKTHALELAQLQQQQQQNLNNGSSGGAVVSGATTGSTTSTLGCSTNPSSTQHNSSPKNIASNNMQSTVLSARKTTCSSPSSTSSSISPPALLPIAASSSPSTNATFAVQSNTCTSPNSFSHSSPSHQFQVHEHFQAKMNLLAMSPPTAAAPPNPSSPCQIMETASVPSNPISTIATDHSTQHFGLIDVKPFQANKRFRHVSSPSTLQQIHTSSANIHVFNPNTFQSSLRTNAGLFPNIIVVENTAGNGMTCSGGNNGNRVLIRKADDTDDAIDINTLLAQPSIGQNPRDSMMISPKPEPTEAEDFFQICGEAVTESNVLEGIRGLGQSQEQPLAGEMVLSQIKEEKEDRSIQEDNFAMENELMNQQQHQQQLVTRIQASTNEAMEDSMLLASSLSLHQQQQQQGLIKNEFILKKEDIEEPMDDIIDDQPSNEALSTQLQESVRLKSEDDPNGDIDWLLTEMMTDSQIETSTSNIIIPQQVSITSSSVSSSSIKPSPETSTSLKSSPGLTNYLSSSVPIGNTVVFGGSRVLNGIPGASISVKNQPMAMGQQSVSQFSSQPKVGSLDNSTLLYEDQNTPAGLGGNTFGQRPNGYSLNPQKKLLGDLFTGTKNPVLPSIYTDSTLIVPEPKASKYHSPHQSLQMFESDFMDIDSFLKGGSDLINTPGDGKDIPESIFNM